MAESEWPDMAGLPPLSANVGASTYSIVHTPMIYIYAQP